MAEKRKTATRKKRKGPGRRAAYAPAAHEIGFRRYLPLGWAYWIGFCLFAFLTIAMVAELGATLAQSRWADAFGSILMGSLFGWMTVLFGISRFPDE